MGVLCSKVADAAAPSGGSRDVNGDGGDGRSVVGSLLASLTGGSGGGGEGSRDFDVTRPEGGYGEGEDWYPPNSAAPREGEPDPEVMLSTCTGRKRALFIGINYFGTRAELRGCINDVHNIKRFMTEHYDFHDVRVLTDDEHDPNVRPTKANILKSFLWLVSGAQNGDSLFVHYSGHGGTERDAEGDEIDGQDETIIPVDYETAGQIVDDEINKVLVRNLPQGVRLTAIFDSCHSGSVLDLPYVYGLDRETGQVQERDQRKAWQVALAAGASLLKGDFAGAKSRAMEALGMTFSGSHKPPQHAHQAEGSAGAGAGGKSPAQVKAEQTRFTYADVIQFSGCRDEQTSADANIGGQATGALSWALIKCLTENKDQTYVELLTNIRRTLAGKYEQVPQMSTGHKMDMNTRFFM